MNAIKKVEPWRPLRKVPDALLHVQEGVHLSILGNAAAWGSRYDGPSSYLSRIIQSEQFQKRLALVMPGKNAVVPVPIQHDQVGAAIPHLSPNFTRRRTIPSESPSSTRLDGLMFHYRLGDTGMPR